jgi:hypothetical protein
MPTYQSAEDTITSQFGNNWSYTPVAYPNAPAINETVSGRPELGIGQDPFIAVEIIYSTSPAIEVGASPLKRTFGNILVEFYTKEDTGSLQNRINLDRLAAMFEYKTIEDISFRDITVMQSGTQNGWYITPAMVRFYFYR